MSRTPFVVVLPALAALGLSACGGSTAATSSASPAAATAATSAPATSAPASSSGAYGAYGGTSTRATPTTPAVHHPTDLITTKRNGSLGTILAYGAKRMTVYLFEADRGGRSACSGACAAAWPPVIGLAHAGGGAHAPELGTIRRPGGAQQVTYHGHPLYLFFKDKDAGDAYGEGINHFGAEWYVMSVAGTKVEGTSEKPSHLTTTASGVGRPSSTATTVSVTADPSGRLAFTRTALSARAGTVTIRFTNAAPEGHNLMLERGTSGPVIAGTPTFQGGTRELTVHLAPGAYTFFCGVPGHRDAGMQGTLTVR